MIILILLLPGLDPGLEAGLDSVPPAPAFVYLFCLSKALCALAFKTSILETTILKTSTFMSLVFQDFSF